MRVETIITCRDLSHYTIYFLILMGRETELYSGRKVFLNNPEDENFTARGLHENVSFDDIKYIFYNLPILQDNGKVYDTTIWWTLLSKSEKCNLKSIFASGFSESDGTMTDFTIKYIYRELLLDQFIKGVIQLPEYDKYLNWWKLLPNKTRQKLLSENLKPKHSYDYTFDDVLVLYNLSYPELDDTTISVLHWWFELNDDKKMNLIHQYINPRFHITAPSIDEIKMLHEKQ